ncbi:MIP/aquaporin family protein [Psychromicrobium lacuslunae]|uniref:MIP/aquaporin family protein n=1 Tax=Psychromicrobium lacuslunae TaxID=1618207 RepID=UPI000695CB25|nr:aquaporin [Psychromicrobium lacuslunae]
MSQVSTVNSESVVESENEIVESKAPSLWARLGAEVIGTFILVFGGLGAAMWGGLQGASQIPSALAFGLALVVAAIAFGQVSGGHFNPAVTLGAAIAGGIKWLHGLYYVIAQVIGGLLAALILYVTLVRVPAFQTPTEGGGLSSFFGQLANGFDDHSQLKLPMLSAALIEIIATAVFVSVILAVGRLKSNKAVGPFAIGLSLAVLLTVLGPFTNGSLNPARSTAVVFFTDGWAVGQLWLFWVAPLIGAALAGLIYRGFIVTDGDAPRTVADAAPLETEGEQELATVAEGQLAGSQATEAAVPESTVNQEARDFFDGKTSPKSADEAKSKED